MANGFGNNFLNLIEIRIIYFFLLKKDLKLKLNNQLQKNLKMNVTRLFLSQMVRHLKTNASTAESVQPLMQKERSLNQVTLIGRVGQDPKVGESQKKHSDAKGVDEDAQKNEKSRVILFSVATNEYQGNDENGNPRVRVDWHRIAVFAPRLQENCEKYVRQGDRVHVTGRLHYNLVQDKAGDQRYVTSIIADDVIFLTKLL